MAATPGFEVVGEAESGEEAVELFESLDPGLVLMDINLPGINGIEATRRITTAHPDAMVLLLRPTRPPTSRAAPTLRRRRLREQGRVRPGRRPRRLVAQGADLGTWAPGGSGAHRSEHRTHTGDGSAEVREPPATQPHTQTGDGTEGAEPGRDGIAERRRGRVSTPASPAAAEVQSAFRRDGADAAARTPRSLCGAAELTAEPTEQRPGSTPPTTASPRHRSRKLSAPAGVPEPPSACGARAEPCLGIGGCTAAIRSGTGIRAGPGVHAGWADGTAAPPVRLHASMPERPSCAAMSHSPFSANTLPATPSSRAVALESEAVPEPRSTHESVLCPRSRADPAQAPIRLSEPASDGLPPAVPAWPPQPLGS